MYIIKSRSKWKAIDKVVERQLEAHGMSDYTNRGGVSKPTREETPLQQQAKKIIETLPPRIAASFSQSPKDAAIKEAIVQVQKRFLQMGPAAVAKAGFGKGDVAPEVIWDKSRRERPVFTPEGQQPGPAPRMGQIDPMKSRTVPIHDPDRLTLKDVK